MTGDLDRRFIDSFRLAAVQAGAVARRLQGKVKAETKPGPSIVAEDAALLDAIAGTLAAAPDA